MTLSSPDAEFLRAVVLRNSGNHVDASRDYLFESRLHGLLRARGLRSLGELIGLLRSESSVFLQRQVAEAMTINETSFFRDQPTFDLLREQLLPSLIASRQQTRTLRFWSAAASSGQEAYSIAMMIREYFPQLASWTIEIRGTDLSLEMVERATAGRYMRIEVNRGLPARFLLKYMVRTVDDWEVAPEIRRMCRFQQKNLCEATVAPGLFDVIFLRNVMLYFRPETKRTVLRQMHSALAPDGVLFLAITEQAPDDPHWQTMLTPKTTWYRPLPRR
jgi:chemotaxis protein methyltransferase CheR